MSQVIVTLKYDAKRSLDLALPAEVPCRVLAQTVARAVNLPDSSSDGYTLAVRDGSRLFSIDGGQSLLDASVMYGDVLELVTGESGSTSTAQHTRVSAYLIFDNGERFKLNPHITTVGRWSPGNNVDLDLTAFDSTKRISRRHARLENRHGAYFLIDESTNGTLVNGQRIEKESPRPLQAGDQLELGGLDGVRMRFVLGTTGELKSR